MFKICTLETMKHSQKELKVIYMKGRVREIVQWTMELALHVPKPS